MRRAPKITPRRDYMPLICLHYSSSNPHRNRLQKSWGEKNKTTTDICGLSSLVRDAVPILALRALGSTYMRYVMIARTGYRIYDVHLIMQNCTIHKGPTDTKHKPTQKTNWFAEFPAVLAE